MAPAIFSTIISIWVGCIGIGVFGAAAALANRWIRVLGLNVIAGGYSIAVLASLKGSFADSLFRAGDGYVWLTMSSLVVMWIILGAGTSLAMWKRHCRPTGASFLHGRG